MISTSICMCFQYDFQKCPIDVRGILVHKQYIFFSPKDYIYIYNYKKIKLCYPLVTRNLESLTSEFVVLSSNQTGTDEKGTIW